MHKPPPTLCCALSLSLSARTLVKPGPKMLSVSSVSHVSVKHIKLLRRKSRSNRANAVNSSILFWKARTFDNVCYHAFSVALSLLSIHASFHFLFSLMSQRFSFKSGHGVWCWKENESSRIYLCKMAGLSCKYSPSVRENRQHKVAQKVADHYKQNAVRCHLHTLVCTLSQM